MGWLVLGLVGFFGMHLVPTNRRLRAALVSRLGKKTYTGLFVFVCFGGLALIIFGKAVAPYIHMWQPPSAGPTVAMVGMLPALILCAASGLRGHIWRTVHHPMLLGALIWALCHLLANGDLASVLLFGAFAAWSAFGMITLMRRAAGERPPLPANAQVRDGLAIAIGAGLYVLVIRFHFMLFGMPV